MARNTENRKKGEMHTVGPGIWMGKLKKKESGTQTLFDLEYGKNYSLMWQMRNAQCKTWSMVKK